MREGLSEPQHGSRTLTINETPEDEEENEPNQQEEFGVLRLHGDMSIQRPRAIQWDESVVDNEHMNKKKSKICCIYHRPHAIGESSESESSDSDSNSDSSNDDRARPSHSHHHHHSHHDKKKKKNPRHVSPNAYERQPVYKDRPQPPTS
ncbi:phosphatase inhibitor-domain-containing protein [Spinellus fusiger]|nr:phosphatase inhibitor-domain-containing protein [Spinellus fusiger]